MRAPLLAVAALLVPSIAVAQAPAPGLTWRRGAFSGRVSAYLQGELQLREGSEAALSDDGRRSLNFDRFLLRRVRLIGTVETRWAQLLVELDGNTVDGPAVGVQNAEATLRWLRTPDAPLPLASLTVGLFRIPFGYQNLQNARVWGFLEPSLAVQAMFPGQSDLGARVAGAVGWFRYSAAVMNGHPVEDRSFALGAPAGPNDFVGRLGLDVAFARASTRLQAGLSALHGRGFHPGSPATPDTIVYRDINQTGALDPSGLMLVPGQPAVPARTFARWAVGADVALNVQPLRAWRFLVFAEALYAQNLDRGVNVANPVAGSADIREIGWVVGTVHTLFDHLVLGVRLDGYDPDADALTRANGRYVPADQSYLTAAFLLGYELDATNKVLVQYDLVRDHLAIDAAGRPTDLRNDRLTARLQVGM